MNVFVLCTGRCGSTTFSKACGHITNYTSGHQTHVSNRIVHLRELSVYHPDNHIEVSPHLTHRLGWLDQCYADKPVFYVHLKRDTEAVAFSYYRKFKRRHQGLAAAWWHITGRPKYLNPDGREAWPPTFMDMVETLNLNIKTFLKSRRHITIDIEDPDDGFRDFWDEIGAEGDLTAALNEFNTRYGEFKYKP